MTTSVLDNCLQRIWESVPCNTQSKINPPRTLHYPRPFVPSLSYEVLVPFPDSVESKMEVPKKNANPIHKC